MSIKVENLTKEFDGRKVLDNISFTVEQGEVLSIVGFSGSGKSTILKLFFHQILLLNSELLST